MTTTTTLPRSRRRNYERPKRDTDRLDLVASLTKQIREHETGIAEAAERRRRTVIALWQSGVTYREIAEAMDVTEQNVYKILRAHIASVRPTPDTTGE